MAGPLWAVVGVIVVFRGLLWTLRGSGVMEGGPISGTTGWAAVGPIVLRLGVVVRSVGIRGLTP